MTTTKAPRAALSGVNLSFGLVNLSVDLLPVAVSRSGGDATTTKLVCPTCTGVHAVRQGYVCTHDPNHGPFAKDEVDRAMKDTAGNLVKVDKVKLADAVAPEAEAFRQADLRVFAADQVEAETIPTGGVYRLRPGKGADRSYVLVMRLLTDTSVAFLTEVTQRSVTRLYRAVERDGTIMLVELCRPDDCYASQPVTGDVDERMLSTGQALVGAMLEEFDANDYADKRAAKLLALRDSISELAPEQDAAPAREVGATVQDLMAALESSVAAARKAA